MKSTTHSIPHHAVPSVFLRCLITVSYYLLTINFSLLLAAPFTTDLSNGEISIQIETTPEKVSPAEDLMLTLTVEAPAHLAVTLPDLRDRFSGFSTAEDFAADPVEANGRTRQTYRWRLVPEPAAERYRLAPFAVTTLDKRVASAQPATFATRPVLFPDAGARPVVTGDPEVTPVPIYIPPTAKTVALWILLSLTGLAALAALFFGLTRLSRRVREYRMSPVERAMTELQRLLSRNLPARGLYKEFYIELTMVVRRYIERTRGIRAPEQTTQEFLLAAAAHTAFTPEVLVQLKTFLESADLVKFAGQEATVAMTSDATEKAKAYIHADGRGVDGNRQQSIAVDN
ncbi:MAG: hypothetical protein LBW77_02940 [Verrucomicrobiota bacterium]|jgi:hypothetical protein|nr:hypothetical protein [Verrucomicrobiota bacterium]